MKKLLWFELLCLFPVSAICGDPAVDALRGEIEKLTRRVEALEEANAKLRQELDVERLGVRKELIVSEIRWDSVAGGDAYIVFRDGKDVSGPIRIEGSQKTWTDGR